MADDGISPEFGHTWANDAQIIAAHGPVDIANDATVHFYDGPSDTANVVSLSAGTVATDVWRRVYYPHAHAQSYQMVFYKRQVVSSTDVTNASSLPWVGVQ